MHVAIDGIFRSAGHDAVTPPDGRREGPRLQHPISSFGGQREAIWQVPGNLGASFLSSLAASHGDMSHALLIALVRLCKGDKALSGVSIAADALARVENVAMELDGSS